jgi:FeS assembly SUF system protein
MSDDALDRAAAILDQTDDDGPNPERLAHVEALGLKVIEAIKTCYDPEIPVNIHDLGLIYRVDIDDDDKVLIEMTLTSPACPVAGSLPGEVQERVRAVEGVADCTVELVWDPPWNPQMMTEEAQLELGMVY